MDVVDDQIHEMIERVEGLFGSDLFMDCYTECDDDDDDDDVDTCTKQITLPCSVAVDTKATTVLCQRLSGSCLVLALMMFPMRSADQSSKIVQGLSGIPLEGLRCMGSRVILIC